jgi:hypothetical protein
VAEIRSLTGISLGLDLEQQSREWLDRRAPSRFDAGSPEVFVPAEDSSNGLPQIELYPGPIDSEGLAMRYRAHPPLFSTDIDTDEEFPDWMSVPAIYAGVLADLYRLQDEQQRAQVEEARFNQLVAEMAGEDARRMPPAELNMSDRYIAHRVDRCVRGYGRVRNWRAAN